MSDDDSGTLSINLPPITAQSRSISGERIETLKNLTAKYRVTVNSMTREGTEVSYTFRLPVGIVAKITVECLNSSGEVIVRAYKEHKVTGGDNSVFISLKNDGNEIINTGLYYSYGDAAAGGAVSGLPAGRKLEVGGKFTVDDGSAMTWEHAEDPTGSGSGFTGWRTNVALTGDTDTQTPDVQAGGDVLLGGTYIMPDGNVTLSAQWNKKQYSLSFDYNIPAGASQSASGSGKPNNTSPQDAFSQVTVGSETPTLNAQGQQWTFKYWTLTQADTGTQYRAFQQVTLTGNITLYAQWTNESVWRVTFDEPATKPTAYTSAMPQGNVVKQGEPFSWTNPSAAGWTFGGWTVKDASSGQQITTLANNAASYTPTQNVTLEAKWTPIPYTVKFNSAGGSAVSDINNFTVNGSDSFAANPTYSGYMFGGWQYNSTPIADAAALRTAITNGSVTATGNNEITLTAQWTVNTYKVKYEPNAPSGATVTPNTTQERERTYGQSFSWATGVFTAPTGYSFAGWNTQADGNGTTLTGTASSDYTTRTGDITVYAKWTVNTYNVTFSAGNGVTNATGMPAANLTAQAYGSTVTIRDVPQRIGYTFGGWTRSDNNANVSSGGSFTIPAQNITLTAQWTPQSTISVDGTVITLSQAFDAVNSFPDGTAVTLSIPTGKTIEISQSGLALNTNKTLTISGGGTLSLSSEAAITMIRVSSGKLVLENITFDGCKTKDDNIDGIQTAVSANNGTVVDIKAGTVIKNFPSSTTGSNGVVFAYIGSIVNMSGGTIENCPDGISTRGGTLNITGGEIKNCKEGVAISGYNNPISKVTLGGNVKITGNEYGIYSNFNVNSGDTDYSAEITIEDSALITNNSTCGMYVYVGSNAGNDVIKITCTDIDSHIKDNPSKQYRIPDTSNVVSSVNFNGQTLTQILQK